MKKALLCAALMLGFHFATAQQVENEGKGYHINGNVSVTNNGFSFIPLFTLGKPATIANLSIGGERFSFEPQFRFDLDGLKPWSFIFMWRYNLIQTDRFLLKPGLHFPAMAFSEQTVDVEGVTKDQVVPARFFTPELTTAYTLTEHITAGTYYILGLGLEKVGQTKRTNFISLRAGFSRIPLVKQIYFNWNPEVYYLNLDGTGGFYAAHTLSISHEKVPLSIATTMNVKLRSDIETKDFDWNISLVYSFTNQLVRK